MKKIILASLVAVAVAGCKKTDMVSGSETDAVVFSASTSSLSRTTSVGVSSGWEVGDGVGIYMVGDQSAYNIEYSVSSVSDDGSGSLMAVDEAITYPSTGLADFYAYYPFNVDLTEGTSTANRDIYVADLSDQSDLGAIDFMVASSLGCEVDGSGEVVDLSFAHQLSKVQLTINALESVGDLGGLVVTIGGANNLGSYSYRGGEPDFSTFMDNYSPISFNLVESATSAEGAVTQVVASAILHPETIAYPSLTFTLGGLSYTVDFTVTYGDDYSGEGSLTLAQGMMHTYDVYLGSDGVLFGDCDIVAWSDGVTVSGTDQAERVGSGTADDPFYVYDRADLEQIGASEAEYFKDGIGNKGGVWALDSYYRMMNNIDLGGEQWEPIGNNSSGNTSFSRGFQGVFDGNGKVVSGLIVTKEGADASSLNDYVGLFGYLESGATIKNLAIVDCDLYGRCKVGGIVGHNSGTVQDCYVSGSIEAWGTTQNNTSVGGIVGELSNSASGIYRSYNLATIIGNGAAGGIVGYLNDGKVVSCYNKGTINNNITSVANGFYGTGGIAGFSDGNNCYMIGCYNSGDLFSAASAQLGGIAGSCGTTATTIRACFNSGNFDGTASYSGAISGYLATLTSCYYLDGSAGDQIYGKGTDDGSVSDASGVCQAIGYDEMIANGEVVMQKLNNSLVGTSYSASAWSYDITNSIYPTLDFDATATTTDFGSGTEANPTQLYFVTDFSPRGVASSNSNIDGTSHYKMMADIDLGGSADNPWVMIAGLSGSFDGGGNTLSGVYVTGLSGYWYLAPFYSSSGTIMNLTIDVEFSSIIQQAGFVFYNYGTITGCCKKGEMYSAAAAAGLVYENRGTINGCSNEGSVSGDYMAGLVYRNFGLLINSYNNAEVGYGLVWFNAYGTYCGTIANCYSIGSTSLYSSNISSDGEVSGSIYNIYNLSGSTYTYKQNKSSEYSGISASGLLNDLLNPQAIVYNNNYKATDTPDAWSWEIADEEYPTLIAQ